MRPAAAVFLLLVLCACKGPEEGRERAIIGAVLIDGGGGPPLTDSVVVTGAGKIHAAGPRTNVLIPTDADRINGEGKFLVPALVDVCDRAEPAGLIHAATAEEARAEVARLAAKKVSPIYIGKAGAAVVQAALEAARAAGIPVIGHISTQAEARVLVDSGASALIGMIRDSDDPDALLLARLRDLRVVVAPALGRAGADLEIAKRNTRRLFQSGVLLAVASEGGDPYREAETLVDAGVPPLDAIVAATRNGAMALHQLDQRGTIEPGKRADLVMVSANPGEDIANWRRVVLRMADGEWVKANTGQP